MDLAFVAQLFVSGVVLGSSYALVGISFGIIFSTTRIFHLAHSLSYTMAAYAGVIAVTSFGLPLWAALPLSLLAAVIVGVGIEALVYRPLRRKGAVSLPFFLSALGLQVAGSNLIGIVFGRENQPMRGFPNETISFGTVTITTLEITSVFVAWVCVGALLLFLRKTQYGHAITATRTNPTMARAVGISVDNVYVVVFAIGSLLIGVAAFLFTAGNVANPSVGLQPVLIAFIAVFLGGIESVSGAALGGLVLGLATTMSGLFLTANFAPVIVFGLLFVLLVVRPQGLLGKAQVLTLMEYFADVVNQILILMILAVSLNVLLGYAGQVSMATAAFYAIGSYATGILIATSAYHNGVQAIALGWDFLPAAAVAITFAFVSALIISLPAAKRVTGEFLILLTLAFQVVVQALVNNLDQFTGGPNGLILPPLNFFGIQASQPTRFFWVILALTLFTLFVARMLGESPFGRVLKGVREDELAVQSVGKHTVGPKMIAFGITAALCGMAGAFAGPYFQFVAPGTYSFDFAIFVVAVVTLGGPGNLLGTVIASIVLGGLRPLLQNLDFVGDANSIAVQSVLYGLALVLLMRVRPEGFLPEGMRLRNLFSGRNGNARPATSGDGLAPPVPTSDAAPNSMSDQAIRTAASADADGDVVLRIEGLDKRFGGLTAVSKVDLTLRRGQIAALIGPNGAGKTTIFNLITGVLRPDEGRVTLNGVDLAGHSTVAIAELGMARSFQNVRLFQQISALDNVAMAVPGQPGEHLLQLVIRPRRSRRVERETRTKALKYLDYVGMANRADERVSNLSFAEQKLVAIARLLATEADVLLLDEPTSGIDPMAVDRIIDRIRGLRDLGKTVCIVEHSLHVVERLADHVFFLDEGKVVAEGTVSEITSQARLVEVYFGT